jgi:hypothetical protein
VSAPAGLIELAQAQVIEPLAAARRGRLCLVAGKHVDRAARLPLALQAAGTQP